MTAAPGTIPALTPYQPGALALTGQEAIEIVNTTNATAAASFSMLLTDVVGKVPSVLPQANPSTNDFIAFTQASTGLPKGTRVGNLAIAAGNVAVGGSVGEIYTKNSGTNFDASWTTVLPALSVSAFTATGISCTTLTAGAANIPSLVVSTATIAAAVIADDTVTYLSAGTAIISTAVITHAIVANLDVTTETVTTLNATNLTVSVASVANLFVTTATAAGLAVTSLTATNATVLGNIIVAGSATLGAPLTVPNGGLGTSNLGTVAVLIGGANNTAPVSTVPATTAGMVLTSNGSTSAPSWFGSMVLLNTLTPSGVASTTDTTSLTSRYRDYMIMFENVCPSTNTTVLQLSIATTGSAFFTGGYVSQLNVTVGGTLVNETSTTIVLLSGLRATTSVATATAAGVSGYLMLQNPAGTNLFKQFEGKVAYQATNGAGALSTSNLAITAIGGMYAASTAPIVGVAFGFSSGNIATGTIKIWGMV